jgi:hypothetical protein
LNLGANPAVRDGKKCFQIDLVQKLPMQRELQLRYSRLLSTTGKGCLEFKPSSLKLWFDDQGEAYLPISLK